MVPIRHRTTNCKTVWVDSNRAGPLQQQLYVKCRLPDSLCMGVSCSDEHGMGGATLQLAVSHTFNMGTDAVNP